MKCSAILLCMVVSFTTAVKANKTFNLQMAISKHVSKNHDVHGQCISDGIYWPNVKIIKNSINSECNFGIEQKRRPVDQSSENKLYCTDFVIRNVTVTCQYQCALLTTRVTKTVVVKDARILQTPFNITATEGMPVKLKCTVMTTIQPRYYKLIWMKGDEFVTGNGYSIESTPFDNNTNTQNHFLTIHKASPGAYTCMLITTTRKIIDVQTQYVVTESNAMMYARLKEFTQFFKWN